MSRATSLNISLDQMEKRLKEIPFCCDFSRQVLLFSDAFSCISAYHAAI
ncbi:hypothetical protein [Methyloglobulus morosus]|nr:hypothetical protein [Methyloglobulus morosus]